MIYHMMPGVCDETDVQRAIVVPLPMSRSAACNSMLQDELAASGFTARSVAQQDNLEVWQVRG